MKFIQLIFAVLTLLIAGHATSALANSWTTTSPPPGLAGTGYEIGNIAYDFTAKDQFGDDVSLYEFYGKTIVLDFCTIWCAACQDWSGGLNTQQATLNSMGYAGQYQVIELLYQNVAGTPSDQGDAIAWANNFGLNVPVLHTENGTNTAFDALLSGYSISAIPAFVVIDPQMKITMLEIGSDFDLVSTVKSTSSVPLPAALPLLLGAFGGLGGLLTLRRRREARQSIGAVTSN
jgi:peroxiredoxin